MKKRNVATIMAATMTMGSIIPVFANEGNSIVIDVRTANGEAMSVVNGEVVKTTIEGDSVILAKHNMDTKIAELKEMEKETFEVIEDGKVVVKKKYDIKEDENQSIYKYSVSEGKLVDNKVVVVVKNNQTEEVVNYEFVGINGYDLDMDFGQDIEVVKPEAIDLAKKSNYKRMTKVQYELEKNADKINVKQTNITHENGKGYDLDLEVTLKDGVKVAEIQIKNVQSFNSDLYVALPAIGDINGHWAEETILNAMFDKWVDSSATFRPQDSITRAEFVKIVNRAFNLENTDLSLVSPFEDVSSSEWYFTDVKIAVQAGYIDGYEDSTFKPNQPITRQEAAKIVASLHDKANGGDGKVETIVEINDTIIHKDIVTKFADDANIADWADESVEYLANKNIVDGYEGNVFNAQNNIRRAEALVMMSRAVK